MNVAENSLGECNIHIKVVENSLESDKHCIDFIEVFGGKYSLHINVAENSLRECNNHMIFIENSLGECNIHMIISETFVAKNINHVTCIVWKDENNQ